MKTNTSCMIKTAVIPTDYINSIITGNSEVKTDGDYKIIIWSQPGTLQVS